LDARRTRRGGAGCAHDTGSNAAFRSRLPRQSRAYHRRLRAGRRYRRDCTDFESQALAKARKGELLYAASASSTYLATEMFNRMAGVEMTRVAYKGAGPAMIGLLSGEVQFMITGVGPILPHVQSGKARAFAVTTLKRTALLPNLPTVHESGVPGYESGVWYAMFAPAGVPRAIVERLNAETRRAMNEPEVKTQIAAQGIEPAPGTPEDLGKYVAAELQKYARVARDSGIKPE
jgi:tripartite-type tricarboxylate transporter receptor subunit TctC